MASSSRKKNNIAWNHSKKCITTDGIIKIVCDYCQKTFHPSNIGRVKEHLATKCMKVPTNVRNSMIESLKEGLSKRQRLHSTNVDRLSDMPESMQLRVLASLDVRHAVQTCVLSKSWVKSWTCIPVLNFCSDGFTKLHEFDSFVVNALSRRQPVKLDKLTFKRDGSDCSVLILKKNFDYASSHGVEELEAEIGVTINKRVWANFSSDSLTSLMLESQVIMGCSFLGSSSGSFKNLIILYLRWALITDPKTFSRFTALQKLKLAYCYIKTDGQALHVHAPKLRYFNWHGTSFPSLKAHLPVLDTVSIHYTGFYFKVERTIMFDEMLNLFNALHKAKSLTLSSSVVHLLTLFPDELVNSGSAFWDLKCLKLDFTFFRDGQRVYEGAHRLLMELLQLVPGVKAYLLHKSRDAKCTVRVKPYLKAQALSLPHLRDTKHAEQLEVISCA